MITLIFQSSDALASITWFAPVDLAVKSVLILAAAGAAMFAMRRASAATRHLVWVLAVVATLTLPLLSGLVPQWRVLPAWIGQYDSPAATLPQAESKPAVPIVVTASKDARPPIEAVVPAVSVGPVDRGIPEAGSAVASSPALVHVDLPAAVPIPAIAPSQWNVWPSVRGWATVAWAIGSTILALPILISLVGLWRMGRRLPHITEDGWESLTRELSAALRLSRPVTLLRGRPRAMPMTWGVLHPKLVLPPEAEEWCMQHRRVVLMHELAHIKRRDFVVQFIVQLARALYWFNPLMWVASRQIALESEGACDDLVLGSETRPSDYAEHLLAIATGLKEGFLLSTAAVAMARSSRLKTRLVGILDGRRNRNRLTVSRVAMLGCLLTAVILPVAAMRSTNAIPWAQQRGWGSQDVQPTTLTSSLGGWRNLPFSISKEEEADAQACIKLSEKSRETLNGQNQFNRPETRSELEKILSRRPGYFYAEFLMGLWHQANQAPKEAGRWMESAYKDAPVVLIQRFALADQSPLADVKVQSFALECNRVQNGSLDPSLKLYYPNLRTDANGCIYLPVYNTVWRTDSMASPEGYKVAWPKLGWFETSAKVGILPTAVAAFTAEPAASQPAGINTGNAGQSGQASTAPSTQPVDMAFGPVIEASVEEYGAPRFVWFDLDSGKAITASGQFPGRKDDDVTEEEFERWRIDSGVDVAASFDRGPMTGLMSLDPEFVSLPVNADQWEKVTPEAIATVLTVSRPGDQSRAMVAEADLPSTWIFKTRQGGRGILQIVGVGKDEKPRVIRIRYKLVSRAVPGPARANAGEVPTVITAHNGKVVVRRAGSRLIAERVAIGAAAIETPQPDPRTRFLAIERIARLPAAEQAAQIERLYHELSPSCMHMFVEGILSSYPTDILDRDRANGFEGNTERWAGQLAKAAAGSTPEAVADKLHDAMWLTIAARARALQVFKANAETVEKLIKDDLESGRKPAVERAGTAIQALELKRFTPQLLSLFLAGGEAAEAAIMPLTFGRDPALVKPLLAAVEKDPKLLVRCGYLFQGPLFGRPAEPALAKMLDSPDVELRLGAARALAECVDPALAGPVGKLARDADPRLNEAALLMAMRLPADSYRSVAADLRQLLKSKEHFVESAAIRCLSKRNEPAVGWVILAKLRLDKIDPGDAVTVMQAMDALTGSTHGYDQHNWGPAQNKAAIGKFEAALRKLGVEIPVNVEAGAAAEGPGDAPAIGTLSGVVTDEAGNPLAGVLLHVWSWCDGIQTRTDENGRYRLTKLGAEPVEIRVSKDEFDPWYSARQPTGIALNLKLSKRTYFEGTVVGPDGKPVPDAQVRAYSKTKQTASSLDVNLWIDARSDANGRYRLHAMPDSYTVLVRVPKIGTVKLPDQAIADGQARPLDIHLTPGVAFRALVVDSRTGEPIPDVTLAHWKHPGIEGVSDKDGNLLIPTMDAGKFEFNISAPGYARWWSAQATEDHQKKETREGLHRNFDYLDFDITPDMQPVRIELEREVRITGVIQDPDGNLVAGATAAPAHTGTGNSLTGDTRYSVVSKRDGTFVMTLPASGDAKYNLEAHDGAYGQWRNWANGVSEPIQTKPGDEINNVVIKLTRPVSVSGTVRDETGKPIPGCDVRASAADKMENRYYDPTTKTDNDGKFALKFVRPGDHFIQAAPFGSAEDSDGKNNVRVTLKEGQPARSGVDLIASLSTRFPTVEEQIRRAIEKGNQVEKVHPDVTNLKGAWKVRSLQGLPVFRWRQAAVGDVIQIYYNVSTSLAAPTTPKDPPVLDYYTISPGGDPKQMDITFWVENLWQTGHGIYRLDGDKLTICMAPYNETTRPTEFKPGKGTLIEFERVKPDEPKAAVPATWDPPKDLEFLRTVPELQGLTSKMTEPEFQKLIQGRVMTVATDRGDKGTTYSASTPSGEHVVVMFDKDGGPRGIQRLRPASAAALPSTMPARTQPADSSGAAAQHAGLSDKAQKIMDALMADVDHLSIMVEHQPQDQPKRHSLKLRVAETAQPDFYMHPRVSNEQMKLLLAHLAADGYFDRAIGGPLPPRSSEMPPKVQNQPGYVLLVTRPASDKAPQYSFLLDLSLEAGADVRALRGLRSVLTGEAAVAADTVLTEMGDSPSTQPALNYGSATDGLQLALELDAVKGVIPFGKPIKGHLHFRNASPVSVTLHNPNLWQPSSDEFMVTDSEGKKVQTYSGWFSGWGVGREDMLAASKSVGIATNAIAFYPEPFDGTKAQHPVGNYAFLKPGKYTLKYKLRAQTMGANPPAWQGELTSGSLTIDVVAAESAPSTAPASSGPAKSPAVPSATQPADAAERAAAMKADMQHFVLSIRYHGDQDKPFYNLHLSVAPVPAIKQNDAFNLYSQISEAQAADIIEYLCTVPPKAIHLADDPGYALTVGTYLEELGWGLPMLGRLECIATFLDGDAGKNLTQLLQRLGGHRKEWEKAMAAEKAAEKLPAVKPPDAEPKYVDFRGTVVDDATGKPVPNFSVQGGLVDEKDPAKIKWGYTLEYTNSPNPTARFSSRVDWAGGWRSRIVADGYAGEPIMLKLPDNKATEFEGLVIRLKRGRKVSGHLLDYTGKPVADAGVFVVGNPSVNLTGGKAMELAGGMHEDKKAVRVGTDANGGFTVTGIAEDRHHIAVTCPAMDLWVVEVPKEGGNIDDLTIRLPEPGKLIVHYDIPGAPDKADIFLQYHTWDLFKDAGVSNQHYAPIAQREELVLNNLPPGAYVIDRTKNPGSAYKEARTLLDRREITIESGKTVVLDFVRPTGTPITGHIVGLDQGEVAKAQPTRVEVRILPMKEDQWSSVAFDSITMEDGGKPIQGDFVTEQMSPGQYKIRVLVFVPETREQASQLGVVPPAFTGETVVTIPETGKPDPVKVELKPWKSPAPWH